MTEEEAKKQALIDAAISVGWDMAGGALSGGIMGGGTSLIKKAGSSTQQSQSVPESGDAVPGENDQSAQETAAEPAPGSLEWMQEMNELGKSDDAEQAHQEFIREIHEIVMSIDAGTTTMSDSGEQRLRETVDEVLGLNTPVDPVDIDTSPITLGMTDEQRAAVLTGKAITPVTNANSANYAEELSAIKSFPAKAKSKVEKTIKALAVKLGILNKPLQTPDVEIDFQFSKGGLSKSLSQQLKYGGSYADFAGAINNLEQILQNAVLIEQHTDKYAGTSRADVNLERVYVLFGAYQDRMSVVPVQMEIKKSSDVGGRLYVTVAMTKIEADVRGSTIDQGQTHSLISASEYSLSEIFQKINPADKHFLKYLPDNFLSEEQKTAKQIALQEDADKISRYKKRGSIATPESEQADSNTPEATGGTAPNDAPLDGGSHDPKAASSDVSSDASVNNIPQNDKVVNTESVGAAPGNPSVGAADQNFTGRAAYQDLLTDENAQRDRPGDVRPVEVPKVDGYGRNVSEFVENAYGSEIVPDNFTAAIEELVQEGALGYDTKTNAESLQKAAEVIKKKGTASARCGVDQRALQQMVGHVDKEATRIYTHLNIDALRNETKKTVSNAGSNKLVTRSVSPKSKTQKVRKTQKTTPETSCFRGGFW